MNCLPRRSRTRMLTAGLAVLALGLTACGGDSNDASGDNVAAAFTAGDPTATEQSSLTFALYRQGTAAPVFGAEVAGATEKYGLDIEPTWVESSAAGMALLLGGDAEVTYSSFWGVVDAMNQDLDVVIVSAMFNFDPGIMTLETLPDSGISSLGDLQGKTVAVPALNSAQHNRLEYALLQDGIDSSTIEIVELPFGEVTSALANGTIDAGSVAGPPLTTLKDEYKSETVLDFAGGIFEGDGEGGMITTREFAEENPNTIAAFQCSWAAGVEAVEDDELYAQILHDELGFDANLAAAEVEKKPNFQTTTDPEKLQRFPEIMMEIGNLDDTVDMSSIILPQPESC